MYKRKVPVYEKRGGGVGGVVGGGGGEEEEEKAVEVSLSDGQSAGGDKRADPGEHENDATWVSEGEVLRACKQMKASCSGSDGVPPELLTHLSKDIAHILANTFTKCLREGMPAGLRHGVITLLAKTTPPSKDLAKYLSLKHI